MQRMTMMLLALSACLALVVLPGCGDDSEDSSGTTISFGNDGDLDADCPEEPTCPVGKRKVSDITVRCGFRCETDIVEDENEVDPVCNECAPGERVVARDDNPCGFICELPSHEQAERDESGAGEGTVCGGACAEGLATVCTCGAGDPCGWADNGQCNIDCLGIVDIMFNDDADCCDGACVTGEMNACACDPSDPCGFTTDSACQNVKIQCAEFEGGLTQEDTSACCQNQCGDAQYTECTCAADDPCGWQGDTVCDSRCAEVVDTPFDDAQDCGG